MREKLPISKSKEQLIKGVNPIFACIGTLEDFENSLKTAPHINDDFGLNNVQNVDWFRGHTEYEGSLGAGPGTYIISPINTFNKLSRGFYCCTGLIVAGITPDGQKISFLTHQDPHMLVPSLRDKFMSDLKQRLNDMKKRCKNGTIDAVIVGGEVNDISIENVYIDSIKLLGKEVQENLGFEPMVINGPKISMLRDTVGYDNENRRIYFIRPETTQVEHSSAEDFIPSDFPANKVDKYKNKWR